MTEPPRNCECCYVQLIEGGGSETPGLCSKCDEAWQAFPRFAPSHYIHVCAEALMRSRRDIARTIGCTSTAHNSALCNATVKVGVDRARLIRVAAWGLRTGRLEKPKGFETCRVNGEHPSTTGTGPVKSTQTMPAPKAAEGGRRGGLHPDRAAVKDEIERLCKEGKCKDEICRTLHTSWETVTATAKERGLVFAKPGRGQSPPQPRAKTPNLEETHTPDAAGGVVATEDNEAPGTGRAPSESVVAESVDVAAPPAPEPEPEPEFVSCVDCRHGTEPRPAAICGSCDEETLNRWEPKPGPGDRAEDYPADAPCNLPEPGPLEPVTWLHLTVAEAPPEERGLSALRRLAATENERDMITVAYELGYARALRAS